MTLISSLREAAEKIEELYWMSNILIVFVTELHLVSFQ